MNSSEPLSSVLQKLVNSLHGEMGYINSTILQVCDDEKGKYYKVKAFSESPILKKNYGISKRKKHGYSRISFKNTTKKCLLPKQ